jgi:hypothetical protein
MPVVLERFPRWCHVVAMNTDDPRWRKHTGPQIDMTPDGEFIEIRRQGALPVSTKILVATIIVAVLAGAFAIAAIALWLALTLIPIAIAGAAIAYGVFRVQLWWARRRSLGGGGHRDLFRP